MFQKQVQRLNTSIASILGLPRDSCITDTQLIDTHFGKVSKVMQDVAEPSACTSDPRHVTQLLHEPKLRFAERKDRRPRTSAVHLLSGGEENSKPQRQNWTPWAFAQNSARTRSACRRKRGGRRAALVGARAVHSLRRPPRRQLRPPRRHTGSGRRSWHSISTGGTIMPLSSRKASRTTLGLSGTGSGGRTEILATRSNSTRRSGVLPSVSALLRHCLPPAARRRLRCAE
jgi:hypothetical protein